MISLPAPAEAQTRASLRFLQPLLVTLAFAGCSPAVRETSAPLSYADTTVSVYGPYRVVKLPLANGVKIANPIQLALGPGGDMFAANTTGEVYRLRDTDGDGLEDTNELYCDVREFGLRSPGGFAFKGDTVFIGTAQQIRAFRDSDRDGRADTSWVFFDDIPNSEHPYEWTSGMTFGPDGHLYVALSTDSWNAGASPDPKKYRGSILRIAPDGKKAEAVATGIRSVYGMNFNRRGDLFFIDNEGGGNPREELNRLIPGAYYGHNPQKYSADSVTGPVFTLRTEVAPSEVEFNHAENDFGGTSGDLFVAYYGPGERWNRGAVSRVVIREDENGAYSFDEIPVADIPKLSNLAFGKDGSLYLAQHGKADYWYNAIYDNEGCFYKLVYDPNLPRDVKPRAELTSTFSKTSIEKGKQLFAEAACLGCHAVDGATELLGPNLQDVGNRLSREEILEEIVNPSLRIKPSMKGVKITKKDGQVLMGRIINATEDELSLMMVGNHVVRIKRNDVANSVDEEKSMMYENLITRLPDADREALLDYMISLRPQ